jgi:hypothetical protein
LISIAAQWFDDASRQKPRAPRWDGTLFFVLKERERATQALCAVLPQLDLRTVYPVSITLCSPVRRRIQLSKEKKQHHSGGPKQRQVRLEAPALGSAAKRAMLSLKTHAAQIS